jgi:hypothetical protein
MGMFFAGFSRAGCNCGIAARDTGGKHAIQVG